MTHQQSIEGRRIMTREDALGLAAQCWCTEKNKFTVMDTDLAEAFADMLMKHSGPYEGD